MYGKLIPRIHCHLYVIAPASWYPGYTFPCIICYCTSKWTPKVHCHMYVIAPATCCSWYAVSCILLHQKIDTLAPGSGYTVNSVIASASSRPALAHGHTGYTVPCMLTQSPAYYCTSKLIPRIHWQQRDTLSPMLLHQQVDIHETVTCMFWHLHQQYTITCMLLHQQLDAQDTLSAAYYCTNKLIPMILWHQKVDTLSTLVIASASRCPALAHGHPWYTVSCMLTLPPAYYCTSL